ncbi:MAG: lysine--tRNA ligase, partial [Alphaproteobacteria bacterium]|nr:lysine--tRNA ligase [Alphaproteobacteria bacterium]
MAENIDYSQINTWPFQEARKILAHIGNKTPAKGYVLFETGYGPSGLPHIGTFGEVARTSMVRWAFSKISDIPTRLIAFSDDMDGLRKVPSNIPNQENVAKYIGSPFTAVPDPFGKYDSFAAHNNAMLREFLDSYGFEYEFMSSTQMYKSGAFNDALIKVLENYDKIMQIMLPTLGEERRQTYSPIMPISPKSGRVLQVPVKVIDASAGIVAFDDEDGTYVEQSVLNGMAKLQWKADWAMRWLALDVDYEMCGADLTDSYKLSGQIVRVLGGRAPENLTYQLFVDEQGQKISKTKGNGISIEEWLKYANPESLALFMYNKPTTIKRLYFDVIPRSVDEYYQHLNNYDKQ